MKRVFNYFLPSLAAMLVMLTGCMSAEVSAQYTEGQQYHIISTPIPTQAPEGKVEVTEIFWYGCPHCYHLEPTVNQYLKEKPENVFFNRVPATLSATWAFHAKMYYVGKMLDPDGTHNVHTKIFDAFHKQRRRVENDDAMRRFFESLGFKLDDVNNALKSPDLAAMMNYAREVNDKSGLDSVPTIVIKGKYLTGPSMMTGNDKLTDVINYLTTLP